MESQLQTELIIELLRCGALSYMFPGVTISDDVRAFMLQEYTKRVSQLREQNFTFGFAVEGSSRASMCPAAEEQVKKHSHKKLGFLGRLFKDDDWDWEESIPERNAEEELRQEEQRQDEDDVARQARIKEILAAVDEIQEKYGVTIEEFDAILSYKVKPSRLRITESGLIILDDFEGKLVRMDPLTKTVFLLFLNHPEGIEFKNISDHRKEIESIYGRVSHSSNPEAIRSSLDKLCNPVESNSLNEKVSRVKRAFTNVVDDRIARHYYIEGPAGGIRRIALDRDLVIWEYQDSSPSGRISSWQGL